MTENEAIKAIREKACNDKCTEIHCDDSCMYGNDKCAFDMAIQALEKQIPKKVQGKHISYCVEERKMCGEDTLYGNCPNCGELVSSLWNDENCGDCGQALDWND